LKSSYSLLVILVTNSVYECFTDANEQVARLETGARVRLVTLTMIRQMLRRCCAVVRTGMIIFVCFYAQK